MKNLYRLAPLLLTLLSGCAATQDATAPDDVACAPSQPGNDYPTRDRVDYVLECVAKHGGLSYVNQYACGCKIDKIAEQMNFADYEAARTFGQMQKTAGEAGAIFRDAQQSKDLKTRLKDAEAGAERACFVN